MGSFLELIDLARRQHGFVSDADATALGISNERWRKAQDDGHWIQIAPGHFRHVATPPTFVMLAHAGAAWLGTRGALHGATSLAWLGVDVATPAKPAWLVPRTKRSTPDWIELHTTTRWCPSDVILHRGLRTTTATRAIVDFAAQRPPALDLEQAIDSAIRLRRTALPRLTERIAALSGTGMVGVPVLRELLLDSGGESHLERRFLRLVRTAGLPRPDTQVVFRNARKFVARVDFRFPGTNVVVEVSGRLGHSNDRDRQRDARRRNALQNSGHAVLEFTTADVIDDPGHVLSDLRTALRVAP